MLFSFKNGEIEYLEFDGNKYTPQEIMEKILFEQDYVNAWHQIRRRKTLPPSLKASKQLDIETFERRLEREIGSSDGCNRTNKSYKGELYPCFEIDYGTLEFRTISERLESEIFFFGCKYFFEKRTLFFPKKGIYTYFTEDSYESSVYEHKLEGFPSGYGLNLTLSPSVFAIRYRYNEIRKDFQKKVIDNISIPKDAVYLHMYIHSEEFLDEEFSKYIKRFLPEYCYSDGIDFRDKNIYDTNYLELINSLFNPHMSLSYERDIEKILKYCYISENEEAYTRELVSNNASFLSSSYDFDLWNPILQKKDEEIISLLYNPKICAVPTSYYVSQGELVVEYVDFGSHETFLLSQNLETVDIEKDIFPNSKLWEFTDYLHFFVMYSGSLTRNSNAFPYTKLGRYEQNKYFDDLIAMDSILQEYRYYYCFKTVFDNLDLKTTSFCFETNSILEILQLLCYSIKSSKNKLVQCARCHCFFFSKQNAIKYCPSCSKLAKRENERVGHETNGIYNKFKSILRYEGKEKLEETISFYYADKDMEQLKTLLLRSAVYYKCKKVQKELKDNIKEDSLDFYKWLLNPTDIAIESISFDKSIGEILNLNAPTKSNQFLFSPSLKEDLSEMYDKYIYSKRISDEDSLEAKFVNIYDECEEYFDLSIKKKHTKHT